MDCFSRPPLRGTPLRRSKFAHPNMRKSITSFEALMVEWNTRATSNEAFFICVILGFNHTKGNAVLLAEVLIKRFGSLLGVLSADFEDIAAVPGIGFKTAAAIKLIHSMIINLVNSSLPPCLFSDEKALVNMIIWTLGECVVEKVMLVYLTKTGKFKGSDVICSGNEKSVSTSSKAILAAACRRGAGAVVIAHNHPSGLLQPTDDDIRLTREIAYTARFLDIVIVDHVIVSGLEHFSFRRCGLI